MFKNAKKFVNKNQRWIWILLATAIAALGFQNCAPAQFSQDASSELSVSADAPASPTANLPANTSSSVVGKTWNIDVTGEGEPIKVITVIDNSATMSQSQTELANATNSLVQGLSKIDSEVLLTTTSPVIGISEECYSLSDVKLASCGTNDLPNDYNLRKEYTVGQPAYSPILFRRSSPLSELNQKSLALKQAISNIGTQGSDTESGLAVLMHILVKKMGKPLVKVGDKAAIVIVTDEDDSSLSMASEPWTFPRLDQQKVSFVPAFSGFSNLIVTGWVTEITGTVKVIRDGLSFEQKIALHDTLIGHFSPAYLAAGSFSLNTPCDNISLSPIAIKAIQNYHPEFLDAGSQMMLTGCKLTQAEYQSMINYDVQGPVLETTVDKFYASRPKPLYTYKGEVAGVPQPNGTHAWSLTLFDSGSEWMFPIINSRIVVHEQSYNKPVGSNTIYSYPQRTELEMMLNLKYADDKKTFFQKALIAKMEQLFGREGFHVTMMIVDGKNCMPKTGQSIGTEYLNLASALGSRATVTSICQGSQFDSIMKDLAAKTTQTAISNYNVPSDIKIMAVKEVFLTRNGVRKSIPVQNYTFDKANQRIGFSTGTVVVNDKIEIRFE